MGVMQYSDPIESRLEGLGLDVQYEPTAARFDAAEGLYWFCNDNYAGQGDPLYSILTRLDFSPGALSRGVDSEPALLVYEALQDGALDPEELLAWIVGRRSNPRHGRKNPTRKPRLVGKRLQAGNASIMVVENGDGSCDVVTVFDNGRAERDGPYTRAKALQMATLAYETMKHQGRINPREVTGAELFWDGQDPNNTGWWLRFDVDGTETGTGVDLPRDCTYAQAAAAVAAALPADADCLVRLYLTGESDRSWARVRGGHVVDWRAA